jgi:hypothetical protein
MENEIDGEATQENPKTNSARSCIFFMLAISALSGFCRGFHPKDSSFQLFIANVYPFLLLACAVVWCYLDSYRYNIYISRRLYLALLLFFVAAFPYYAIKTCDASGWFTIAVAFLLAVLCWAMVYGGTALGVALA